MARTTRSVPPSRHSATRSCGKRSRGGRSMMRRDGVSPHANPPRRARRNTAIRPTSSSHVFGEPGERTAERLLVGGLVVAAALVAREAVAGVIDVNLAIRTLLLDDLHIRQRDRMILVA